MPHSQNLYCPNCRGPLRVMVRTGADESVSDLEEALCHCYNELYCGLDWEVRFLEDGSYTIQRYYFG